MKFAFIAKHRGIWPTGWLCGALGVSRGGWYAWLTRPASDRARANEALLAKVRASLLASDRTYGARRVWRDMLADGIACGLHRIERLMRHHALRARPDAGGSPRTSASVRRPRWPKMCSTARSRPRLRTANGLRTLPISGPPKAGCMWLPSSISSRAVSSVGR